MEKTLKNLGGRPKKPAGEVRNLNLACVRITADEREKLRKDAENAGKTLTAYVRRKLGLR